METRAKKWAKKNELTAKPSSSEGAEEGEQPRYNLQPGVKKQEVSAELESLAEEFTRKVDLGGHAVKEAPVKQNHNSRSRNNGNRAADADAVAKQGDKLRSRDTKKEEPEALPDVPVNPALSRYYRPRYQRGTCAANWERGGEEGTRKEPDTENQKAKSVNSPVSRPLGPSVRNKKQN